MNEKNSEFEEHQELKHLSLNHDHSCFITCTKKGFFVFKTSPFVFHATRKIPDLEIVEMINNANVIGYVTKENKVVLFDIKKRDSLGEIPESRLVLGLKFTKNYMVLVFKDEVDIYSRANMDRKIWNIKTCLNEYGLCCSSWDGDVISIPSEQTGHVFVVDIEQQKTKEINAHNGSIRCISLNKNGKYLATASDKGTLVRVFDCDTEKLVKEFRRGRKKAEMYSINFSDDSQELCCYSSRGTVHVFSLTEGGKNRTSKLHVLGYLGFSYISSIWSKEKATVLKNSPGVCTFGETSDVVVIATLSGHFSTITFKENQSPELKQESIFVKIMPTVRQLRSEVETTLRKFPERVPVKVLIYQNDKNVPLLDKKKFLVPKTCTVANFGDSISKKLDLSEGQKVKFYVGDNEKEVLPGDQEKGFEELYDTFVSENGFLHIKYTVV